jgi:transglutaminase-like putative cysteine protease
MGLSMILNRESIPAFLFLLLFNQGIPVEGVAQKQAAFEKYSQKYPNNSVILISLREEIEINITDGKPVLDLKEYKEYLALNDDASFFAGSKETFGSIFKFKDIESYTLVPEKGGYKKIPVTSFNKTSETTNSLFYDDITVYNFTFPSVVRGSKMISRVSMSSDDPSFPFKSYFGDYFPCEDYSFIVTCPEYVDIRYEIFGRDTSIIDFSFMKKAGKKIYSWRASNPKSYIKDDYAPDASYFVPHVIIQVSKYNYKGNTTIINNSLDDLYKRLYKRISSINLSGSDEIKALTDSLTKMISSDKEKVRRIYRWVQKNIKYVAFEDGENGFVPRNAELVIRRKYGDCKDKTSLLVAMMKSQGLNASFAWIGTRDIPYNFSGLVTDYNFNHMIAVWWDDDNNPVVIDGTTHHNSLEDIPSTIQGKECLIENGPDKYKVYSIPVAPPEKNIIYDSLTIELKGDTLTGNGTSIINGEFRSYLLDCFEGKKLTDLPEIVNNLMPKASNKFMIKSVNPVVTTDADSVLKYNYKFFLPDYMTKNHNTAYLNLNLDRYLSETNLKDDRWIPVELNNTKKHIFICTFKIPDGYEVRDIPKNSSYYNKLFGYNHSYEISDREIKVKTVVTLNFQVIEGSEMALFREMLSQLNINYIKTIPLYKTITQ